MKCGKLFHFLIWTLNNPSLEETQAGRSHGATPWRKCGAADALPRLTCCGGRPESPTVPPGLGVPRSAT